MAQNKPVDWGDLDLMMMKYPSHMKYLEIL